MLFPKSDFLNVSTLLPDVQSDTKHSWKQRLSRAFSTDIDTGLNMIEKALKGEDVDKFLKELSIFLDDNQALLVLIAPDLADMMSAEELRWLYEFSKFKEPEEELVHIPQ